MADKKPRISFFNRLRNRQSKKELSQMQSITPLISDIDTTMKDLYRDTYISDRNNLDLLNTIADKIEDNIDSIIQRNSKYDVSNTSRLYARALLRQSGNDDSIDNLSKELESLFETNEFTSAVMGSYMSNKWIDDLDTEIDTILKYFPKLREALEVLKDAVLSADSTSKQFIHPKLAISDDTELKIVTDRIIAMEKKYDLPSKIEDWYDLASEKGEAFVYRVPYSKAIEKLLNNRDRTLSMSANRSINIPVAENGIINNLFTESGKQTRLDGNYTINIEISTDNILESCVMESYNMRKVKQNVPQSLMESYKHDIENGEFIHEKTKIDKVIPDDITIPDGLMDNGSKSNSNNNPSNSSVDVRGCVVKTLKRKNLIRLYIDDNCIGYYYLEFKDPSGDLVNTNQFDKNLGYSNSSIGSMSTIEKTITDNIQDSRTDHMMKNIAKQISDKLDATFVNSNQDLTKEIYTILKYNDIFNSNTSVRISFLPAEDVKWLRFNEDHDLHMGISDLYYSLIPAKMRIMMYMTYVIGTVTRGQDKRVYYVKQTIETNIAQTLLNTINQIKKSNFNMRSIENLNNLLNITGRFNDFIVPVGPSGDSPIQFEVMPGQDFNMNTDLMDMLEEASVNPIAPLEIVNARMSPDFATQYTSSSLKLIRKTYRRQARLQLFISDIYSDIYATEYGEYQHIECELPSPIFLTMVNTNQLIDNAKSYVETIAEIEYAGDTSETAEQEKSIFIKKMMRSMLSTYIKQSEIELHKSGAKFEMARSSSNDETE